jgi:hypothetical protein
MASAYTSKSDFYFSIHENGINRLTNRLMLEVPSLFNYGSTYIRTHPQLACNTIKADPSVTAAGDPLITGLDQIDRRILPSNFQLPSNLPDFIFQLSALQVDFHPGDAIALPPTVPQPLQGQRLALRAQAFMGLACPAQEDRRLQCFSLDLFTELSLKSPSTTKFLEMGVNALDVVEIEPDGLRKILDCYLMYFANQALRTASDYANSLISGPLPVPTNGPITNLKVSPAAAAPNNPAVEDNQLKLYLNLNSFGLHYSVSPSGGGPSSNLPPAASKTVRTRPGHGPSDITAAISQGAFSNMFGALLNGGLVFRIPDSGMGQYGNSPVYFDYAISASLHNGTISLRDDGTVQVKDLEIWWDTLKLYICIDIPKITIGAIHIPGIRTPDINIAGVHIPGVQITPDIDIPGFTLFGDNPDIIIPIDLSGIFVSQVSAVMKPAIFYGSGNPNRWQFYAVPQIPIFIEIVKLGETLDNLVTMAINTFFNNLFSGYPSAVVTIIKDTLKAALVVLGGPIIHILDDPGMIAESILDMLVNEDELGIFKMVNNGIYNYFTNQTPIYELPDPLQVSFPNPITPLALPLIRLQVPIAYLGVSINSSEMVLEADFGS